MKIKKTYLIILSLVGLCMLTSCANSSNSDGAGPSYTKEDLSTTITSFTDVPNLNRNEKLTYWDTTSNRVQVTFQATGTSVTLTGSTQDDLDGTYNHVKSVSYSDLPKYLYYKYGNQIKAAYLISKTEISENVSITVDATKELWNIEGADFLVLDTNGYMCMGNSKYFLENKTNITIPDRYSKYPELEGLLNIGTVCAIHDCTNTDNYSLLFEYIRLNPTSKKAILDKSNAGIIPLLVDHGNVSVNNTHEFIEVSISEGPNGDGDIIKGYNVRIKCENTDNFYNNCKVFTGPMSILRIDEFSQLFPVN